MASKTILDGIIAISDFILRYAVTLAALAALTVGLIEAYKKLFNTQARFHRSSVKRWLAQEEPTLPGSNQLMSSLNSGGHYGVLPPDDDIPAASFDAIEAYRELLHLTTGVRQPGASTISMEDGPITRNVSFALFELELARMMAQVQEAADAALSNPGKYRNLFMFLTRGVEPADVEAWRVAMERSQAPGDTESSASGKGREALAEVYARIRLLTRRQLDSFQTVTSYRWREWNQLWAWVVGGVLLLVAQLVQAGGWVDSIHILKMVAVSLAGGILAPVAKDLVDALAKVKSGG